MGIQKISLIFLDYLNQKNGTSYRASSKKNKSLINARFSEGYSVDDFKKNISAIYFHPSISEQISHKFAHGNGYIYRSSKEKALQFLDKEILSNFSFIL